MTFENIVSNLVYFFCELLANFEFHQFSTCQFLITSQGIKGKANERVVKTLLPKEDYGIISGKEYDGIKDTLDLNPELQREELCAKKKKR